jgi:hypothetical protein
MVMTIYVEKESELVESIAKPRHIVLLYMSRCRLIGPAHRAMATSDAKAACDIYGAR